MQGKSRTLVFIAVGLVLAAVFGYFGFRALRRPAASARGNLKVVQVTRGAIEVSVSGSGNVAFAEDVQVRSQVSGTVAKVLVKDGQKVEAGQPLFVLKNDSLELSREKAQSNVQDLSRAVTQLKEDIAALSIVAPEAGRVTNVAVSEGERVNEGATLLTLVDDNTFSVTVPFLKPERDRIKVGDTAEVFLPDFLSSLQGKVVKVSATSQPASGGTVVYPVTVDFPNPGALEEGISALVTVKTGQGPVQALEAGTIAPKKVAEIRSSVAGEVQKIHVEANDKVRAGQLLIELTNDQLPSNLTQQEAALAQARMELEDQESQMAKLTITAPISGVFRENEKDSSSNNSSSIQGPVQVGDELKPNDPVG
ncbi:MAG: biotin/lipoyl-binding protein, partial [Desulfofundulus sp.]